MLRVNLVLLAVWCASSLGCGGQDSVGEVTFSGVIARSASAGRWRTWRAGDPSAYRPVPPPPADSKETYGEIRELAGLASTRSPSIGLSIADWQVGTCMRWNELQRSLVIARRTPPPMAARGFALVSVAMYDAMVAAWDAKYAYMRARPWQLPGAPQVFGIKPNTPSYVSERAAISAAAAPVLRYLFPQPGDQAIVVAKLQSAMEADLYAGIHFRSDVEAGREMGERIGSLVVAYARGDHASDAQPPYASIASAGRWEPTPQNDGQAPVLQPALPGWGRVKTWAIRDGSSLRPVPPPAPGTPVWAQQVQRVLDVNLALTDAQKAIADFWADGAGTVTPPGHWNQIACEFAAARGLDECRFVRMLALLNVAQADAFVACWDCKYAYNTCRPVTEIRKTRKDWVPYINTPPFPSYPSGHATTSGAAARVLSFLFPDGAAGFQKMADAAKESRLLGGIHYPVDNDVGLELGRLVGDAVIQIGASDGATPSGGAGGF